MKRQIGVLTYHHVINPGAILQSYALSKLLQRIFIEDEVSVIDYRPLITEWRDLHYAFSDIKRLKVFRERFQRYWRLKKFFKEELHLSQETHISNKYEKALAFLHDKYDLIVVGSDEIWKIETSGFGRPFPNVYWLDKSLTCKKVSYAASANTLAYEELDVGIKEIISERLSNFDLIGVRDDHTFNMVSYFQPHSIKHLVKVPDPTFTLELKESQRTRQYLERLGVDFTKPLLGITFFYKPMNDQLLSAYRARGYQILALSAYNPEADVNLEGKLDPFQWAQAYRYLNLCFTNLFHGTIFCLKSHIPFLSVDFYDNSKYESKIKCLLKELDMLDQHFELNVNVRNDYNAIVENMNHKLININYEQLGEKLEQKKRESEHFIARIKEVMR